MIRLNKTIKLNPFTADRDRGKRAASRLVTLGGLGLALGMTLGGCTANSHKDNVHAAEKRWRGVRSAVMLDMAKTQFKAGQLKIAKRSVQNGLHLDPANARLLTLAGRIEMEKGHLERADDLFRSAAKTDDDLPDPHYYRGVVFQRWEKFDQAYKQYEAAYERQADAPEYLVAMSDMLVAVDQNQKAIELLSKKLQYFDQNAGVRAALGQLYRMAKQPQKSASMFRQATLLDPDNANLKEQLADAQISASQFNPAIQTLHELLGGKKPSYRPDLWRDLANAQVKAGKIVEARHTYFKLSRQTDKAADWISLAQLSFRQDDMGATLHAAKRAVQAAPERYESYLLAGMVWQKRQRPAQALRLFDQAAEYAPNNAQPLILRGVTLQKAHKPIAAADAYKKALKRDPTDHRALKLLANVTQTLP